MAEWSKALVLGTSLFGGASSNLAAIKDYLLFPGFMTNFIQQRKIRRCNLDSGVLACSIKFVPNLHNSMYYESTFKIINSVTLLLIIKTDV